MGSEKIETDLPEIRLTDEQLEELEDENDWFAVDGVLLEEWENELLIEDGDTSFEEEPKDTKKVVVDNEVAIAIANLDRRKQQIARGELPT